MLASHDSQRAEVRGGSGAKIALLLVTVVILGVILEVGVRFLSPQPMFAYRFTTNTWYEPTPGASFTFQRQEFRQQIRYNSHGLRDREHAYERPDGVVRIAIIGDSFTEGLEVALSETFPRRLEERLNRGRAEPRVEVINLGISGFGTIQCLKRLERDGFRYAPDWVFYLACWNDFADNLTPAARRFYSVAANEIVLRDAVVSAPSKIGYRAKDFVKRHVQTYRFLKDRLQTLEKTAEEVEPAEGSWRAPSDEEVRIMRLALRKLRAMCAEHSAELAASMITPKNPESPASYVPYFRDLCRQEEIPFVDLTPAFAEGTREGRRLFYHIDGHWNAEGQDVASRVLEDFFRTVVDFDAATGQPQERP